MSDYFDLYDYRFRVVGLYHERNRALLDGEDPEAILQRFRAGRDRLFAGHPQSALDEMQRRSFAGLRYFPYNATLVFSVDVDTNVEPVCHEVVMDGSRTMTMTTAAQVHFTVEGEPVTLSIYWLDIYGGGLFLPFRDATCPKESYGAGRYLFDTIKGSRFMPASCATGWSRIVLDFNYAYNPSCAYNSRWVCPLAPPENRLSVPIRAGEMNYKE